MFLGRIIIKRQLGQLKQQNRIESDIHKVSPYRTTIFSFCKIWSDLFDFCPEWGTHLGGAEQLPVDVTTQSPLGI